MLSCIFLQSINFINIFFLHKNYHQNFLKISFTCNTHYGCSFMWQLQSTLVSPTLWSLPLLHLLLHKAQKSNSYKMNFLFHQGFLIVLFIRLKGWEYLMSKPNTAIGHLLPESLSWQKTMIFNFIFKFSNRIYKKWQQTKKNGVTCNIIHII